jgi:hypothetical protein
LALRAVSDTWGLGAVLGAVLGPVLGDVLVAVLADALEQPCSNKAVTTPMPTTAAEVRSAPREFTSRV